MPDDAASANEQPLTGQIRALTLQLEASREQMKVLLAALQSRPEQGKTANTKDAHARANCLEAENRDLRFELKSLMEARQQLLAKIADLEKNLEQARRKYEEASVRASRLEAENRDLQSSLANLHAAKQTLLASLQTSDNKNLALQNDLAASAKHCRDLQRRLLPDQDKLLDLATALAELPEQARDLCASYYSISQLPLFLAQCGKFNLLAQFWKACFDFACAHDGPPPGLARLLGLMLELHNQAFPQNPGREILAAANEFYDYDSQFGLGPASGKIAALLLPGLRQPNGGVAVKALVRLA